LNRISPSFGRFMFRSKQYLLIFSGQIESELIKGDNEVRTVIFDAAGLAQ
jgi:hypothetical protein